jgi:RNA polymerase sigma-70 factor (ECF subfamily)
MPDTTSEPSRALAALAERFRPALWRYLRVLGADAATADDLVQEALVVALQREHFDAGAPGGVFNFLRTTARQLWRRAHDRRVRDVEIDEAEAVWWSRCGDGPGDDYIDALRACIERLPARSQTLLAATYGDGDGRTAAGRRIGLSEAGVKSALRRLRSFLHDCIVKRLEARR